MTEPDLNHDDTATLQEWAEAYQMYKLQVAGTAESWNELSDEGRRFWIEMSQRKDSSVIKALYQDEWAGVRLYWRQHTTSSDNWDSLIRDAKLSWRRKYRSVKAMEKHNAKDTVDWNLVQDYYERRTGPGTKPWVHLAGVLKDRWRDEYLRSLLGNDNLTAGERRAQQDEAIEWTRVQEYYRNQCHQGKWGDLSQTQKDNWRDSYRFDRDVTKEIKAEQSVNDQMARARDEIDRFEATSQAKDEWAKVNHYCNESCGEGGDSWTELGDSQRLYWRRKYRMSVAMDLRKTISEAQKKLRNRDEGWTASLDQMKKIVGDIDAAKKRMDANPTDVSDAKPKLSDAQMDAMIKSLGQSNTSNDPVNHPSHYTDHPSGVECIQITEHMGFNLGNAMKYIWRADLKGNVLEDLAKAEYYIKREIALRKKQGF